jgi:hypothetical protein
MKETNVSIEGNQVAHLPTLACFWLSSYSGEGTSDAFVDGQVKVLPDALSHRLLTVHLPNAERESEPDSDSEPEALTFGTHPIGFSLSDFRPKKIRNSVAT